MECWIGNLLKRKQIINYSLVQCIFYLNTQEVNLENYDIICIGKLTNNQKNYSYLKIIASSPASKTLQGPHEVVLKNQHGENLRFWVWSLTTLRKRFLKYIDRFSFERSAYLVVREHKVLIRLKNIRSMLTCPRKSVFASSILKIPKFDFTFPESKHNQIVSARRNQSKKISRRTVLQQQTFLEQSLTSYFRENENTGLSKQEIYRLFEKDIFDKMKKLELYYFMHSNQPQENHGEIELHELEF